MKPEQEHQIVKKKIEEKVYFKDALDWYFVKYLSPISERSILLIMAIFCLISISIIFIAIKSTFPLKESIPIVLSERDSSKYAPIIKELNAKKNELDNINEAVARYLVKRYIIERESFDYSEGNIDVYNKKLLIIQNSSSISVTKDFKERMDIDNPDTPLKYFGRDVVRDVEILSFKYIRKEKSFSENLRSMFLFDKASNEAVITYKETTKSISRTINRIKRVKVSFYFDKIKRIDGKNEYSPIKFFITEYKHI